MSETIESGKPSFARLSTLDAVRGFALCIGFFYIPVIPALEELPKSSASTFLIDHLTHAEWHGFCFVDLGYPYFIMVMGASLVFSYMRRMQHGQSKTVLFRHLVTRSLAMFLFAVFLYGGFSVPFSEIAVTDVFIRLSICYFFMGLVYLLMGVRAQIALLFVLLLGYWAALALIPIPEYGAGSFARGANFMHYVRSLCPTGRTGFFVQTPTMFGSCIIGLLIGHWLNSAFPKQQKGPYLFLAGLLAFNLAGLWDYWLPINKRIWTPSYTVYTAGGLCMIIGGGYHVIEVWGFKKWAFPLVVFGRSPLAAWGLFYLVPFDDYAKRLVGEAFAPLFGHWHQLVIVLTQVGLCWMVLFWLFRRQIVLKI